MFLIGISQLSISRYVVFNRNGVDVDSMSHQYDDAITM